MRFASVIFGLTLLLLSAGAANAALVTWTIDADATCTNCGFEAEESISGSFDYDDVTNQYSNISITTTAPFDSFAGMVWGTPTGTAPISDTAFGGMVSLVMSFAVALDNTSHAATSDFIGQVFFFNFPAQTYEGVVTSSVVPIPPALALFLSGLAALGFVARRRRPQGAPATA